ncbi:hypothetical protein B0A67_20925 [Flavobacterium aquidurense]|jgi:hypothetical protein|uniref:hypothetical protein n=1 Tax=Flavobacterium aquidurense TaxID=362413 RepID=UPI000916D3CA|nr:hypothetical protein [Flavobacterium aquidurense]OXA68313.1 hypothetical protein B0A67_20925 [Flavobacterium aquidurense]SHH80128.1 hypothetical protein SAMN05444481_12924 [Flavobacterium frigidimaris]
MKLFITSLIIVLLNVGTKHTERKETIKTQNINTVKKATLKTFTYEDIARYTMASIMGQQPKIITATKKGDLYYVSYIRKSDNIKFDYKIKFEGNKILWSNIDGRWRNSQYDEKVTFIEKNNKLSIIQIFSDGSKDVQEYKKGQ